MNIFAVSHKVKKCARALDDARLRKMVLETAQMLCTAINLNEGRQVTPYRNSHPHSALTKWAMSKAEWSWLYDLGIALGKEYEHRFGKVHRSATVIAELSYYKTDKAGKPTHWHNAAANDRHGISFKHVGNVHKAYRLYLRARWLKEETEPRPSGKIILPTWTNRDPPKWK